MKTLVKYNKKIKLIIEKCIIFTGLLYIYLVFSIGLIVNFKYFLNITYENEFSENELLYYDIFYL